MIDAKQFMEALDQLEETKGIAKEDILEALKEALRKAYVRDLGGGDDADVRVIITTNPPAIEMVRVRDIVEEDDIEDDYLQVSPEEAKAIVKANKASKIEDGKLIEAVPVEELKRYTASSVKSALRQKLNDAEKQVLYASYKDKIGEMVSGTVEKCDDHGANVIIGRSSVYISRKELIGDEMFAPGSQIRLFVSDVSSNDKGAMIRLSRSDAGFLKRLFEESVREIYDGSVIIKNIAREAGLRSKISLYTNDPNIDPIGACIGVGGKAIQNILSSLGAKATEKVDLIQYSPNAALYIIDALRPAQVIQISVDEENKKAIAIVENDKLRLAVGKRGSNARVASKLTGFQIDVKEESFLEEFKKQGHVFKSVEQVKEEEENRVKQENYNRYLANIKAQHALEASEEAKPLTSGGIEKMKPQNILDEDIKEEVKVEAPVVEEVKPVVEEVKVEEKPVIASRKEVKTTTTLEDLEQSLESEKKREAFKATQKTSKRPKTITEKEVAHEPLEEETKKVAPKMDIYTEEELREFENESYEDDYIEDEEIDYDEYEEFYDDDDK